MNRKKNWGKWIIAALCVAALALLLYGCMRRQGKEKLEDLEYTVVKPEEIPETLAERIEQEKEASFEITYIDNAFLYIARGYGVQETGGYSISVEACYLAENALCIRTVLTGPQVGEQVHREPSYPYIVLKTELREEKVIFE